MMHNAIQDLPLSVGGVGLGGVVESEDGCGLNVQTVVGKQLNGN